MYGFSQAVAVCGRSDAVFKVETHEVVTCLEWEEQTFIEHLDTLSARTLFRGPYCNVTEVMVISTGGRMRPRAACSAL